MCFISLISSVFTLKVMVLQVATVSDAMLRVIIIFIKKQNTSTEFLGPVLLSISKPVLRC